MSAFTILLPDDGESLSAFARRVKQSQGEVVIVLSSRDKDHGITPEDREIFLKECQSISSRLRIATRNQGFVAAARAKGLRVVDRVSDLRKLIGGHPQLQQALRALTPHVWRRELRSKLQNMGLLSLPKLRVWVVIALSGFLFLFVLFRLLPSAEVRVWPREDTISQTANVFLVLSGAVMTDIPQRVRTMELIPIRVEVTKSLTFDQISKEFIGTSAQVPMTVVNKSSERYSLRQGSRLTNQAGMTYRLQEQVIVEAGEEVTVRAMADDEDLYGEIIGARGNVPAGLRWDFPGLLQEARIYVYAENRVEATGGETSYRTVLQQKDIETAQKRLEQELLAEAKQLVDEERALYNARYSDRMLEILYYDELTKTELLNFNLPTNFLGEEVQSVPIEGSIIYTAYAYDTQYVLNVLSDELRNHVSDGKNVLDETLTLDRLVAHVIDYTDDLSWIKLTVDLTGTEQFILDPLMPTGARFGKKVRESIVGKYREEAVRILKNLPEVENVEVKIWPPWSLTLPIIPSQITIVPMKNTLARRPVDDE